MKQINNNQTFNNFQMEFKEQDRMDISISEWNFQFQITVIHAEAMTEFSSTAEQITDCQQQTTDVRKKQRTIVPTEKTVDVGRGSSICVRVSKLGFSTRRDSSGN